MVFYWAGPFTWKKEIATTSGSISATWFYVLLTLSALFFVSTVLLGVYVIIYRKKNSIHYA